MQTMTFHSDVVDKKLRGNDLATNIGVKEK